MMKFNDIFDNKSVSNINNLAGTVHCQNIILIAIIWTVPMKIYIFLFFDYFQ